MRQPNKDQGNVFLLTLVDFLFQIIFFGMFFAAAYSAASSKDAPAELIEKARLLKNYSVEQIEKLIKMTIMTPDLERAEKERQEAADLMRRMGVSNFVELNDKLSRMVPVEQISQLKEYETIVKKAGGKEVVIAAVDKYLGGIGKPHCLLSGDGRTAVALATLVAYDDHFEMENPSSQLQDILSKIGTSYEEVRDLKFQEFVRTFSKLNDHYKGCMHTFRLRERTQLVHARNALSRTGIVRPSFVN